MRISPKHGLNPSMLKCPICGADTSIALHGSLPGDAEAPRVARDREPCETCCKDIEGYKKRGFVLFVISDEYDSYKSKATPWQFFAWLSVLTHESVERIFDFDMSQGCAFITRQAAVSVGIEEPKA